MTRTWWRWARLLGGAAILAVLVARLGPSPLRAVGDIGPGPVAAALAIGLLTTVACAWRWRLVAHGLGAELPLRTAVAAYYRSLFLNSTLPGGVLGDVHRGVRHGRDDGDVGRGLRGVVWDRTAGQVVQAALTLAVLLLLPSPVRAAMPVVLLVVVAALAAALLAARYGSRRPGRAARIGRAVLHDGRAAIGAGRAVPGVVLASVVVVVGHATTFVIAARTAGTTVSVARLVPLSLLVLLAMSVPVNVAGGWGPREGVAAWAFAAAGLGAARGVGAGVVYGVLALVSVLPGAAVLVVDAAHRRRVAAPDPARPERIAEVVRG